MSGTDLDADLALLIGLGGGIAFAVLTAFLTWLTTRGLMRTNRALRIAEFRQEWIDGLRSDMAEFQANVMMGVVTDHYRELRHHELRARIAMRLNPGRASYEEFQDASLKMIMPFKEDSGAKYERYSDFTRFSQHILKEEWGRLKSDMKAGRI